ncbi:hypothetical protein OUZ56_011406 [Daphnia magna]|uniref:Uncharacterized protein n=1 Tax=Daphnia magna TaxID=35525 RepID=A0ABQ9Z1A5_9CRUS|nr:hypothetical protein OUZ56_011406 [Daphnia magna]
MRAQNHAAGSERLVVITKGLVHLLKCWRVALEQSEKTIGSEDKNIFQTPIPLPTNAATQSQEALSATQP